MTRELIQQDLEPVLPLQNAPNKLFLSDKSMPSRLLQKAQKPRQHTVALEQGRWASRRPHTQVLQLKCGSYVGSGLAFIHLPHANLLA
jgi:hypothetical protein